LTTPVIGSLQNAHVAAARSLLTRKGRAAASAFLVEGPHAAAEALASPGHPVRELFLTPQAAERESALVTRAEGAGVTVRLVSDRVLRSLRDTVTPQGVLAVVAIPAASLVDALGTSLRLAVLLESIADPGNAGSVIRTADAAGADAVLLGEGSVDVWSGKAVRATAGSVFHLPVVAGVESAAAIAAARAAGCQVLATAADGPVDLDDLADAGDLAIPTMWVFGNEAHGVRQSTRDAADRCVRLPMYGAAESLNLAAAAAICLYASARALRR
jgi:TrmH family RNA methyltransferase